MLRGIIVMHLLASKPVRLVIIGILLQIHANQIAQLLVPLVNTGIMGLMPARLTAPFTLHNLPAPHTRNVHGVPLIATIAATMRVGAVLRSHRQLARPTRPASGIRLLTIAIPAALRNAAMAITGIRLKIAVCRIPLRKLARLVLGGIRILTPAKLIAVPKQRHHAKHLQGVTGTRLTNTAHGVHRHQLVPRVITIIPKPAGSA